MILSKNTITLRSKGADITEMSEMLEADFSKDQLKKILESFQSLFDEYNVVTSTMILSEYIPQIIKKITSTKKAELSHCAAVLLSSPECVRTYLGTFPTRAIDVFRLVDRNVFISFGTARDIYGAEVGQRKKGWGFYNSTSMDLTPPFTLLKTESFGSWGQSVDYLTMPKSIRPILSPYISPEPLPIITVDNYEPGTGEKIYSTLSEVEPLYPVMHTLYLNGNLEMGRTKVTATTIKRVSRQLTFSEFFPESPEKNLKNLAATLATSVFCLYSIQSVNGRKVIPNPPHVVARRIVSFIRNSSEHTLTFFAGLILSKVYPAMFVTPNFSTALKQYFTALSTYAAEKWLLFESIENHMRNSKDFPSLLFPVNPGQTSNFSVRNDYTGKFIAPFTIISQFTLPVFQLITGALASLGILEMVYTTPSREATSVLGGIKAVRLTPLGRYALGLTEDYDSAGDAKGPMFEFDTDRLIMMTLGDNNPYETILRDYLVPVGEHRFSASAEKFLEGCITPNDLDRKISNFRLLVGDTITPVWTGFLDDLLHKCAHITSPSLQLVAYQIDSSDRELVGILTSDARLRELTVAAEGFMLLVKKENLAAFKERMRKYGYLV